MLAACCQNNQPEPMRCFVYKSNKRPDTYVYLPREDDFEAVPEPLRQRLGALELVLTFDLEPGRRLARTTVEEVQEAFVSQGFYLQLPPVIEPEG